MSRSFSIRHYAMGFSILIILLFVFFSIITYNEVSNLQKDITFSNNKIGKEELQTTISDAIIDIKGHASDYANWEEVSQQINNPLYYAYWREHRSLQAGIVPKNVLDSSIYDKNGVVLSTLDTSTLPDYIDIKSLSTYIEVSKNKLELIVYHEVYGQKNEPYIIGYIVLRADLMPELVLTRQYNYIDRQSIQVTNTQPQTIPVSQLINYLSFDLRPNEMMDEIMNIATSMLSRMAIIIGVPTLLLYPLVTFIIARPLRKISQHIDHLRNDTANQEPPDLGCILAVSELEKVNDSLNEYHKKLFDVHTSLDDKNKELWTMAHHDSLTGTLNRRAFDDHWRNLHEMFSGGRLEVCLAIFDVNSFKAFNDSYGHNIGDEVLIGIAHSIMDVLRKGEKLYRLGGDEFACVFVDCNKKEAQFISERCEKAVAAYPFSEKGIREPVRISIGLSHAGQGRDEDLSALQWQADIAMYSAKQPGRSHIAFYSEDMKEGVKGIFSSWINNIVYEAITDGTGICMHYQPIVTLDNLRPDYYEALIRIERDDKLVMPGDIFQLVEARRLEIEMDMAILKAIYTDLNNNIIPHGTGISVNVSGKSIINQDIVNQLKKFSIFINDYKLVLEVTETALITQIDEASINLEILRDMGFLVALDDFGSGYSSVRYLATMPVDIVKFDISLIRSLADQSQKTIVKHLASMISETGHKLVAEGIETEELLKKVTELNFAYGQGYLFGKPISRPIIDLDSEELLSG